MRRAAQMPTQAHTARHTEAGEEFDGSLTKAEASKKIDELQHKTGRGEGGKAG